jgi:glycosyltransferase involved in cell wall biosynthesis
MKNKTIVSVIMPAYNEEKLIDRAIKSIINQSFTDWELIVVDDGSTDCTVDIIKSFARKDHRVVLVKNDINQGIAETLNIGIRLSRGEYIARMDADDESLPKRLEMQLGFMEKNPEIDVLGTGAVYIDSNNNTLGKIIMPESNYDIVRNIMKSSPFIHPSIMMKKRFITKIGMYNKDIKRAEDYDLWFRAMYIHSAKFHNLPEIHLRYLVTHKRVLRSVLDCGKVRIKYAKSGGDYFKAIFWSFIQFLFLVRGNVIKNK